MYCGATAVAVTTIGQFALRMARDVTGFFGGVQSGIGYVAIVLAALFLLLNVVAALIWLPVVLGRVPRRGPGVHPGARARRDAAQRLRRHRRAGPAGRRAGRVMARGLTCTDSSRSSSRPCWSAGPGSRSSARWPASARPEAAAGAPPPLVRGAPPAQARASPRSPRTRPAGRPAGRRRRTCSACGRRRSPRTGWKAGVTSGRWRRRARGTAQFPLPARSPGRARLRRRRPRALPPPVGCDCPRRRP